MYIKKTYDLGNIKEVALYYPGNYGAPGRKRRERKKPTPEEVKKQNQRNRERHVWRILAANFWEGGWHTVLTFRLEDRPKSIEDAKKVRKEFMGAMRREYKKAGRVFKYLCVMEAGERGAVHFHLITDDIAEGELKTTAAIAKHWAYGSNHFTPLYREGDYKELAAYLVKAAGKTEAMAKAGKMEYRGEKLAAFSRSRNLIDPEPAKEKIYRRKWGEEPGQEDGWQLIKDTLVNGTNPATGRPYQKYEMRSTGRKEEAAYDGGKSFCRQLLERAKEAGRRGKMACGMRKEGHPGNAGRDTASGKRDADEGGACRAHGGIKDSEPAMPRPDLHGVRGNIKRGIKRLAYAVAGERLEERKRKAGKKRGAVGGVSGKRKAP